MLLNTVSCVPPAVKVGRLSPSAFCEPDRFPLLVPGMLGRAQVSLMHSRKPVRTGASGALWVETYSESDLIPSHERVFQIIAYADEKSAVPVAAMLLIGGTVTSAVAVGEHRGVSTMAALTRVAMEHFWDIKINPYGGVDLDLFDQFRHEFYICGVYSGGKLNVLSKQLYSSAPEAWAVALSQGMHLVKCVLLDGYPCRFTGYLNNSDAPGTADDVVLHGLASLLESVHYTQTLKGGFQCVS